MMTPSEVHREPAQAVIAPGETPVYRGAPARAPRPSAELESARAEHEEYVAGRERAEQAGVQRALLLLGAVVLAGSIFCAGLDRVFVHGWWRQW